MYANMGENNKPNSLKELADKTDGVLKKLDKIQKGTKRSPKPTSPTKPSIENIRKEKIIKGLKEVMSNRNKYSSPAPKKKAGILRPEQFGK